MMRSGLPGRKMLGTPLGKQDERAWNASLPCSISSLSFFMTSFTHGFKFGLERSPNRQTPGPKGWRGSWTTGDAEPSTGRKVALRLWTQPASPTQKLGGEAD